MVILNEFDNRYRNPIIALAAIISPILVAVINNSHQSKIKAQEFEYNNQVRQFEIYYNDKKTAFLEFIHAAGVFTSNRGDTEAYANLFLHLIKQYYSAVMKTKPRFIVSSILPITNPLILMRI